MIVSMVSYLPSSSDSEACIGTEPMVAEVVSVLIQAMLP